MNSGTGMLINANTRIKGLLEANQEEVINALVKLNKNFSKLKNPLLRNLFARRITIADACKIAGCPVGDFLDSMQQIGFKINPDHFPVNETSLPDLEFIKNENMVELDVRPILAQNQDPLKIIVKRVKDLKEGQSLKLINTFEPIPLIHLLADQGFSHHTEFISPDMVITYFQKDKSTDIAFVRFPETAILDNETRFDEVLGKYEPDKVMHIDVRELEMPKPMLLILDHVKELGEDEALFVFHKKRPVFLLPELEKSGFGYLFKDTSVGDVNMLIYKP